MVAGDYELGKGDNLFLAAMIYHGENVLMFI